MLSWFGRKINARRRRGASASTESAYELSPEEAVIEAQHELAVLRAGIREVLEANSVLVSEQATDFTVLRALRQTFGKPALAEQLLRALKRTGAVTAYRDLVDEGVRVRVAVTRRDRQPWIQGPQDGPETVEMDADGSTLVPRKIDPEYAAAPPLPPEPEYQYSRLNDLPPQPTEESAWDAFLGEPPAAPMRQSQMGSALLGIRPAGGVDPNQPHWFVGGQEGLCNVCRLPFAAEQHQLEGTTP